MKILKALGLAYCFIMDFAFLMLSLPAFAFGIFASAFVDGFHYGRVLRTRCDLPPTPTDVVTKANTPEVPVEMTNPVLTLVDEQTKANYSLEVGRESIFFGGSPILGVIVMTRSAVPYTDKEFLRHWSAFCRLFKLLKTPHPLFVGIVTHINNKITEGIGGN